MTNGQTSVWTNEAVSQLTKLWLLGTPAKAIAIELGPLFTKNSVVGKSHRLHLPTHDNAKNCGWKAGVGKSRRYKPRPRNRIPYAPRRPDISSQGIVMPRPQFLPPQTLPKPFPVMVASPAAGRPVRAAGR